MLPKTVVPDALASPEDFDHLIELIDTTYAVDHEQTTLESIALRPDGTLQTPAGAWQVTQDFLEDCARAIGMPLAYAYKVSAGLFCENFAQRRSETAAPITISRVGDTATGLIVDKSSRYRPAHTGDVLRALRHNLDLVLRQAYVSFAGVDLELVCPSIIIEPLVGDILEVGIAVTMSESGGRHLKAAAYSHRLICTNGAIMADELGVARWPNDPRMSREASLRTFETDLVALSRHLERLGALYARSVERKLPDVELLNLWRRVAYLLSPSLADDVLGIDEGTRRDLQQLIRHRSQGEVVPLTALNVYEVHNRITNAAHGRPFRVHRGLQELGGDLLSRAATWPPPPPSAN